MENYFFYTLILLFLSQLYAPVLATKIKKRLSTLGYEMKSSTLGAMLNVSGFWREASKINNQAQDKLTYTYLKIYYSWWFIAIVVFLGYIASEDSNK